MRWIRKRATAAAGFSGILRRCAPLSAICPGKQVHARIVTEGLLPHVTLQTDLILMYSRCSDLLNARRVFDDMPDRSAHTWNILFYSYAQSSHPCQALRLLHFFLKAGFRPDHYTFPSLLKACVAASELHLGMSLHRWVLVTGYGEDAIVGSSLLDMYAKFGFVNDSKQLFKQMRQRDTVACNSMISALARSKLSAEALRCFRKMQWKEVETDPMAIPSVLSACGHAGDLKKGKEIHGRLVKSSLAINSDAAMGNALLEMYSRCGRLCNARKVFAQMRHKNTVTWTTLISCCGVHGEGEESVALFDEMLSSGVIPNAVTFTSILSSCSHSGMVAQGRRIFRSMSSIHGVEPKAEHYACMVDLLARAGNLQEALCLMQRMPMEPPASIWGALLGGCVTHEDAAVAELAASRLFALEPRNAANYAALCGVYAAAGSGGAARRTRARMKELRLVKSTARSWIPC